MPKKQLNDIFFMNQALLQAKKAARCGEVPIGAVAVMNNKVIARAYNKNISLKDPSAHAEILALRKASRRLNNHRLNDIILYTTIEPCPMCFGAMLYARVKRVVFGANDKKAGACGSVCSLNKNKKLNHTINVTRGILEPECRQIIQSFFHSKRKSR